MDEQDISMTIPFVTEDGEQIDMYVLEETIVQGVRYILVTDELDEESEEAEVAILKESKSAGDDEFAVYDSVDDEDELKAVAKIFAELMDDVDFEM